MIKDLLWGLPTVLLLNAVGLYFTVKSKFFQIFGIREILKNTLGEMFVKNKTNTKDAVTPFRALATALGGTIGIGSIVGVGYCISVGGAGSIFWMWIGGFFGMMLKYAEVCLSVKNTVIKNGKKVGGPMYCLKKYGFKYSGYAFCVFCLLSSLCSGNLAQTNAFAVIFEQKGIPTYLSGTAVALLLALIIFKGQKFIARLSGYLVPAVSVIYMLFTILALILLAGNLPNAFIKIFTEAFGFKQAAGGFSAAILINGMRIGTTRGTFSHEAGMGSSPIVHSSAENITPHKQGQWGIAEIYIDTFLVSTVTALCLISAGTDDVYKLFFSLFGFVGEFVLFFSLPVFAFASIISWCYYSESCIEYMFLDTEKPLFIYRVASVICGYIGAVADVTLVWDLADIFNALMIFPNIFILIIKRKTVMEGYYLK